MKYWSTAMAIAAMLAPAVNAQSLPFDLREIEPNFLVWQHNPQDDNSLRAHISLGYLFNKTQRERYEFYFSYTGEFDFYALTRPSSPVVNRLNNPALHYRWIFEPKDPAGTWLHWIDGALEHRSNGQAGEVVTPAQEATAQTAYLGNDHVYFDSISHSTHYLSLQARSHPIPWLGGVAVDAKAKLYLAKESSVNWGPLKGSGTSISDYDRLTLTVIKRDLVPSSELTVQWVVGDKLFRTDSFNVDFHKEFEIAGGNLPLYIRYHRGPLHVLADYTKRQQAIGIGLKFSDFMVRP